MPMRAGQQLAVIVIYINDALHTLAGIIAKMPSSGIRKSQCLCKKKGSVRIKSRKSGIIYEKQPYGWLPLATPAKWLQFSTFTGV